MKISKLNLVIKLIVPIGVVVSLANGALAFAESESSRNGSVGKISHAKRNFPGSDLEIGMSVPEVRLELSMRPELGMRPELNMTPQLSMNSALNINASSIAKIIPRSASSINTVSTSQAELTPLPQAPMQTLPIDPNQSGNIPCDQIIDRLVKYNDMARQHDASVNDFLGAVSGRLGDWYSALNPLEGQTQSLPIGIFAPIQKGSDDIANLTGLAWENTSLLATELDRLILSLRACL